MLRHLAALLLALPIASAAAPPTSTCLVVRIADGDTLTARCGMPGDYQQVKVRLAEIDAPEKAQPFGERSRQALAAMCAGEQAVLRPTVTDRYGRTVARVECRGKDANAELVRTGMAWAYTRYQTDPQFPQLEHQARAARAGLWVALGTAAEPVPPWEWRKAKRGN
ncbi:thermonuclease family protein [Variovorax boronicumulans]|uniref:thermonuclease family protein n=1 Tax=Variovorax boronicumulans TaxID=436515 RepID=UPI001C57D94B